MPRVVVNKRPRDEDETVEESSSSDDEESIGQEEEEEEEEQDVDVEEEEDLDGDDGERGRAGKKGTTTGPGRTNQGNDRHQPAAPSRLTLSLSSKNDVCKVCGKRGHKAGFVGATYMDCPNRPCYLCKLVGHTTATCPYRIAPGHGCTPAAAAAGGSGGGGGDVTRGAVSGARGGARLRGGGRGLLGALQSRECFGRRVPRVRVRVGAGGAIASRCCCFGGRPFLGSRCCTLEFHPTHDGIVVSGDKKGGLAVWNFDQVHERTVYDTVHSCLTNSIRFLPWIDSMSAVTASSDGTAKLVDLETGDWRPLLDLNPGGWVQGGPWHMVYGCDASPALGAVLVGDSNGCVHLLDPRTRGSVSSLQLHRKGNKVVSVHMHPLHPPLVLTAGNDHSARLFDIRELSSAPSAAAAAAAAAAPPPAAAAAAAIATARTAVAGSLLTASPAGTTTGEGGGAGSSTPAAGRKRGGGGGGKKSAAAAGGSAAAGGGTAAHAELAVMPHPRVVNAAYFSPHTGRRILTTCQDNRLRVWDYAPYNCNGPADREIVHSHDFNRYLTPFKGEWDAKDPTESVFVVGRYISEDFGGVALHPVDMISASDGALLHQLTDTNLTTISPVNKPHPRRQLIVSGSSRSLYLWAPIREDEQEDEQQDERDEQRGRGAEAAAAAGAGTFSAAAAAAARASRTFVSFDADPAGESKSKKGKKGEGKKGEGKGKGGGKGGGGKRVVDDDDDDD
ncbi:hypothetical protein PLESTM_000336600 [Pleodorina starrii]|nr:hypothetical protein PLESTM_000336600 [Pleodorina starrii]